MSNADKFLNRPDVRKALGVADNRAWESCDMGVNGDFMGEPGRVRMGQGGCQGGSQGGSAWSVPSAVEARLGRRSHPPHYPAQQYRRRGRVCLAVLAYPSPTTIRGFVRDSHRAYARVEAVPSHPTERLPCAQRDACIPMHAGRR